MAFVMSRLVAQSVSSTGTTTLFTATGNVLIKQLIVTYTSGSAMSNPFIVNIRDTGNTNYPIFYSAVAASTVVLWNLNQVISSGEIINCSGGTGSNTTVVVSGIKF